jgi:uncharacterized membrane protein YczE
MAKEYFKRLIRLIFGLFLYALGSYMTIQANVGLAPWECFQTGIMYKTGIMYGNIVVGVGVIIILIDFLLKEKIGVGTILNAMLIGKFVDLLNYIDLIPKLDNFPLGIGLLFAGEVVLCVGSFFYIGSSMGAGPRDSMMVALGRRLNKLPIGVVRGILEATVLFLGWMMGAKVGIGTVIAVFGISTIMEYTFRILRFDVKGIKHENLVDTINRVTGGTK